MPIGLQIWDESGNLIVDATERLIRLHSSVSINSTNASGSIDVPTLTQGDFVYFFVTNQLGGAPTISLVGTEVFWTSVATAFTGTLYIGTY